MFGISKIIAACLLFLLSIVFQGGAECPLLVWNLGKVAVERNGAQISQYIIIYPGIDLALKPHLMTASRARRDVEHNIAPAV